MPARPARPAMGIATEQSARNKQDYLNYLALFDQVNLATLQAATHALFAADAHIAAAHPINQTVGGQGYLADVISPLGRAFQGLVRRNEIVLAGSYEGAEWVTSMGTYAGHFVAPWLGIAPSQQLAFVRFGEFHRMQHGHIVDSQIFLGVAELLIALDRWPLEQSNGYEGLYPGPATHDGIQSTPADPALSRQTGTTVENMLLQLTSPDAAWRPFWDDKMAWYGPGGFGSYHTVDAFHAFQVPFEQTFEGWGDGRPDGITGVGVDCKAGDGNYAFLSGWPAITGVQVKPFMGIAPSGKRIYLRDCDWWRCQNGKIIENWCMVDTLHLAHQLGRDVIAEAANHYAPR